MFHVSIVAQKVLDAPIMKAGLTNTIQALAKGKSPSLNKLTVDLFKTYWSFKSTNFTTMVNKSMRRN